MKDTKVIRILTHVMLICDDSKDTRKFAREQIKEILDGMDQEEKPHTCAKCAHADEENAQDQTENAQEEEKPLTREKDAKNKSGGVKREFDKGKLKALRRGGWPVKKIAEEMRCSEATIYNHMKKEGIK